MAGGRPCWRQVGRSSGLISTQGGGEGGGVGMLALADDAAFTVVLLASAVVMGRVGQLGDGGSVAGWVW